MIKFFNKHLFILRKIGIFLEYYLLLCFIILITAFFDIDHFNNILIIINSLFLSFVIVFNLMIKNKLNKIVYFKLTKLNLLIKMIPWSLMSFILGIPYLFLLDLYKLVRIRYFVNFYQEQKEKGYLHHYDSFALLFSLLSVLIYFFALLWMFIESEPQHDLSTLIKSMYYVVTTMATVGYGDITPKTDLGRIFAMFIMFIGIISYSLVVAEFSSLLSKKNQRALDKKEKMNVLYSFLKHYKISEENSKNAINYYSHLLSFNANEKETEILSALPTSLKNSIENEMKLKQINKLSIFKNVSFECKQKATNMLSEHFYNKDDYIVKVNEEGGGLFLILHGLVQIENINNEVVASLSDEECFGEMSALNKSKRTASVRAISFSKINQLSRENLETLMNEFPEFKQNLEKLKAVRSL